MKRKDIVKSEEVNEKEMNVTEADEKKVNVKKIKIATDEEKINMADEKSEIANGEKKLKTTNDEKKLKTAAGEKKVKTVAKEKKVKIAAANSTYSITWGDRAENHAGMEMIGTPIDNGFTCDELKNLPFANKEIYDLKSLLDECKDGEKKEESKTKSKTMANEANEAVVVVIRGGVEQVIGESSAVENLYGEVKEQKVDKKAKMRGRVVNKLARWNNCYGDDAQEADFAAGKGTVVAFSSVPHLSKFREALPKWFGPKANKLVAETNYYYDVSKCGIGYHGDSERRIVICARFGASMPLVFRWFHEGKCIGKPLRLNLHHGDLYVMSHFATGFNWKRRIIPTLRHAAGCESYLEVKKKK